MSNPYVTSSAPFSQPGSPDSAPTAGYSAAVQQIPVLSILMMIHGGLTIVCGLLLAGLAAAMPAVMQTTMQNQPGAAAAPQPALWVFSLVYGVPALAGLISGGIQLWGGWKAYQFQSRTLAFLGITAAFASVLTCYCGFTGLGLGVYGLILLLDSGVAEAFAMGSAGAHRGEVLNRFARVVYHAPPAPPQ